MLVPEKWLNTIRGINYFCDYIFTTHFNRLKREFPKKFFKYFDYSKTYNRAKLIPAFPRCK